MAEPASTDTSQQSAQPAAAESAAASSGATPGAAPGDLAAQLAAAKQEAATHYERYLRTIADLENFRKRTVREKEELRQFAASRVLEDLLPVLDNLALGLAAANAPGAEIKALVGGIELIGTQLKGALAVHGLKEIAPAGQPFDPNQHEALSQQPSADVPEGTVLQVIRPGYSLNGRLLRAAAVVVSGGPAKQEAQS